MSRHKRLFPHSTIKNKDKKQKNIIKQTFYVDKNGKRWYNH